MSAKGKKPVVPKLRFAEFREAGEWSNSSLEELYVFKVTNSFSREQLNYEIGEVKNIHYGDIHTKFSTSFDIKEESVPFINPTESLERIRHDCYCEEGDMIFADASEDLNDVGKSIEIVSLNNEKLLSGLHTLLVRQKKSRLVIGFGGYLFKSNRIRAQIKREAQGAKVLGISAARISRIDIAFPINKKEQQKIAACLASLDDLISAATERLDAIKQHKQGLMQQLLPAEGETVPKLRFAEFRGAGEWEEKRLEELSDVVMGQSPKSSSYNEKKIGLPLIQGNADIQNRLSVSRIYTSEVTKECKINDILISVRAPVGTIAKSIHNACIGRGMSAIRAKNNNSQEFLYQWLFSFESSWQNISQGGTFDSVNSECIRNLRVPIPSIKEQQKIAACLTALDDLIAAQTQKIAKLKTHKRGLMQQLFPAVDEAHR